MLISSVSAVWESSEMAEMRATRSYLDWSYSVIWKVSSKSVLSPDAAIVRAEGFFVLGWWEGDDQREDEREQEEEQWRRRRSLVFAIEFGE